MAGRYAARDAKIYLDTSSAANGSAQPVSYLNQWTADFSRDGIDVTSFGDANETEVSGLAKAAGSFDGFCNMGVATFANLIDGKARKMYLYPETVDNAGVYWHGTVRLGGSFNGSVKDAIKVSLTWKASSDMPLVGSL